MLTTNFHEKEFAIADRRFEICDETKNSYDFEPLNRLTIGGHSNGTTTKKTGIAAEVFGTTDCRESTNYTDFLLLAFARL